MKTLCLDDAAFGQRDQAIRQRITPLVRHPARLQVRPIPKVVGSDRVICATDNFDDKLDHEHQTFNTTVQGLIGQYYETWRRERNLWYLCKAYLHISLIVDPEESPKQIVALHCEPSDDLSSHIKKIEAGPHFHLTPEDGSTVLSKSHWPLNYGHLDHVFLSCENLEKALADAIEILKSEVFERFRKTQ